MLVQQGQGHVVLEAVQEDRVDHPRATDGHLGDELDVGLGMSHEACTQVRVDDSAVGLLPQVPIRH